MGDTSIADSSYALNSRWLHLAGIVTMNGWLRLVGEPGWVLWKMHGAAEGIGTTSNVALLVGFRQSLNFRLVPSWAE
eukprot:916247-Amphidinium_carterae.1